MPKFASREEYEEWKDGKIVESGKFPLNTYEQTSRPGKSSSGIIKFIIFIIIVLSGIFVYLEYFRMDVAQTDTSYTNLNAGLSVDLPEGWKKFEVSKELMQQIDSISARRAKILFMISPRGNENTVYGIIDMHEAIPRDRENAEDIIQAVIAKMRSKFESIGFDTGPVSLTIDGLNAYFIRAIQGDEVMITGFIMNPQKKFLMFLFDDDTGSSEQEFWASARSLKFLEN